MTHFQFISYDRDKRITHIHNVSFEEYWDGLVHKILEQTRAFRITVQCV